MFLGIESELLDFFIKRICMYFLYLLEYFVLELVLKVFFYC